METSFKNEVDVGQIGDMLSWLRCRDALIIGCKLTGEIVLNGCDWGLPDVTMPMKKAVFSFSASRVSKDAPQLAVVDEIVEAAGMGVRGKGQRPFLCSSR